MEDNTPSDGVTTPFPHILPRMTTTDQLASLIESHTEGWTDERRSAFLDHLLREKDRADLRDSYDGPAELMAALDPHFVITPAIATISAAVERAIREPRRNLLVTMPPQEGKSTLCSVAAPLRALQINPDQRIILATYAAGLAEEHSRTMRSLIERAGSGAVDPVSGMALKDRLGFTFADDRRAVDGWKVKGHDGGLNAVGIGGTTTGRRGDLIIIDDPFKDMAEADSKTQREKVLTWFRSVAMTRLAPTASIILVQTRWHEEDLAGKILELEKALPREDRRWKHINIPAVSEDGVPDALGRDPGVAMVSARGRTKKQFADTRTVVGERVWSALYQGQPTPSSGGLFHRAWWTKNAVEELPENPNLRVVAVDPADSGKGDEAGVIAAQWEPTGHVTFFDDRSGKFTADEWAGVACQLAFDIGASVILVEAYAAGTTYEKAVRDKWRDMGFDRSCPKIVQWRGTGDAVARSGHLRQAAETGRARVVVGRCPELVSQSVTWQQGQHQPDRVAAAVIAHTHLVSVGQRHAASGIGDPTKTAPSGKYQSVFGRKINGM
ncbi:terminase large subunit [Rhodococcus phage ReqiPine5]|uniref:TerL n=1 Tax=Rhodococcus phage ReqiPine5 TaxID=691963 RepID=D4P7X6_9CAUD|nr:terminase large subunit [Rhodococcus phage ReqiPine5]ADD81106.1 TerL [Rhodococcus phage ReqiPine5]